MLSTTNTQAEAEFRESIQRKDQFIHLVMNARRQLEHLYQQQTLASTQVASLSVVPAMTTDLKRQRKQEIIDGLRQDYAKLKASWGGNPEYDGWFSRPINNAKLNTIATYYELVPRFNRLLAKFNGDLPKFYAEVARMAKLSKEERDAILEKLGPVATSVKPQGPIAKIEGATAQPIESRIAEK